MPPGTEHHGQVTFGGLPVPGATVTASQGSKKFFSTTDQQGLYSFPDLADGKWTLEVEMTGFATVKQSVVISPNAAAAKWELKLLPLDQIKAQSMPLPGTHMAAAPAKAENVAPGLSPASANGTKTKGSAGKASAGLKPGATPATPTTPAAQGAQAAKPETPDQDVNERAADGFLLNGSMNNGAASPFAQSFAFGNARGGRRLYNGGIGFFLDNSALDARPYSLSGQNSSKPAYNRIIGTATLNGPLRFLHLHGNSPYLGVNYQWTRNATDTTQSALVPSLAERGGDFSQALNALGQPVQIYNPATGLPFSGNMILPAQISLQAQSLLNFYPLPTFSGNPRYNYQTAIVNDTHQDALQSHFNQTINSQNQLYGLFAFQSARTASPNLFGFLDTSDSLGINTSLNWTHRFAHRLFQNVGYQFSRQATRGTPFWENRANVSGAAGITGNAQDPMNWGPPSLGFSSGIQGLSDGLSSHNRNQTGALSYSLLWSHNPHNITVVGDFRRQEFNYLSQQNPRGVFTFTGAASEGLSSGTALGGFDFADFLLGIPDTSAIAFGNADKYFRQSVYDAGFTDDWRISPALTLNAGMRWEYGAPMTELYGRLVNLDIAPGFLAAAPVVGSHPVGALTGQQYPDSLIRPDKRGIEPRVGIAWRPSGGSSLLIRAGYGIYDDTSIYQSLAVQMAQQAPLSKSLSVQNSTTCPLTLANGFNTCGTTTPDTFAIDPNYRVGYAQNWQVSVQRDMPGSLQLTATYLGIKGTRGMQKFLPNTFPLGAVNPCSTCPIGFADFASNGNSTRESGQVQLRRRLHNGLTASLRYTYSKSIDDDSALGGQGMSAGAPTTAQNWLDLGAERGLSTFDQRHLLNAQFQYTTGMGLGGKTLMSGWQGALFKEWSSLTQITYGSGLPETPVYIAALQDTGVTGTIRPDSTGAALYTSGSGLFLNPAAYAAPPAGQWGNAGRDSITGPDQFTLNTSLARTFRMRDRLTLDFGVGATNAFNHVTFTSWNSTINSTQFGLPSAATAMRSLQTTLRLRF